MMHADLLFLQRFTHAALTLCRYLDDPPAFWYCQMGIACLGTAIIAEIFLLANAILQKTASHKMIQKKTLKAGLGAAGNTDVFRRGLVGYPQSPAVNNWVSNTLPRLCGLHIAPRDKRCNCDTL